MQKAVKASSKVYQAGWSLDTPSTRQQVAITALEEALQGAERLVEELSWMLKYKKAKDGEKVTVPSAKIAQAAAARSLGELVDTTKGLKVLLPQKEKETTT